MASSRSFMTFTQRSLLYSLELYVQALRIQPNVCKAYIVVPRVFTGLEGSRVVYSSLKERINAVNHLQYIVLEE